MNDPGRVNARGRRGARQPRRPHGPHGPKGRREGREGRGAAGERWIYGVHAVERRLRVAPDSVRTVLLDRRDANRHRNIDELAARHAISVQVADDEVLRQRAGSEAHQGVAALVTPFEYGDLAALASSGEPLLALDQMNDPQNLGALIRTAVAAGFAGVLMPDRGAVGVTGAVEKASAGAVNDLAVCRVVNLVRALEDLAAAGYWRLALTPRAADSLYAIEIPSPVVLVLGGESGLRRLVLERCDLAAAIPQVGTVESLNASVAGAIAMYEVLRRRLSG